MPKAAIFFANGLEEIEGLTVVDMFRRAHLDIEIVSVTGDRTITGSHNITIQADRLFEEMNFDDVEMFILPGGMPGTKHLRAHEPLCELLKKAASDGRYIAAICAAPSVPGELGLLSGRRATCYPGFEDRLTGARATTDSVVVDGHMITSRGMGTAIPFAAELIALLKDRETAESLKKSIIYS